MFIFYYLLSNNWSLLSNVWCLLTVPVSVHCPPHFHQLFCAQPNIFPCCTVCRGLRVSTEPMQTNIMCCNFASQWYLPQANAMYRKTMLCTAIANAMYRNPMLCTATQCFALKVVNVSFILANMKIYIKTFQPTWKHDVHKWNLYVLCTQ